jgi:hypothetical protein
MVTTRLDEAIAESLKPGSYPDAASVELQDLWIAVGALESRIAGLESTSSGKSGDVASLANFDRLVLARVLARLAVMLAVTES